MRKTARRCCLFLSLAALACASGGESATSDADAARSEHARQIERLRASMRQLGRIRDERLPQAMDSRLDRDARVEAIARSARQIAVWAERAALDAPDGPESLEFRSRADTLARLSLDLARRAPTYSDAQLRDRLSAIDATCSSCHRQLRHADVP